jgi:hypothetical protein
MSLKTVLHESLTDRAQLLLLGAIIVGLAKGTLAFFVPDTGWAARFTLPPRTAFIGCEIQST